MQDGRHRGERKEGLLWAIRITVSAIKPGSALRACYPQREAHRSAAREEGSVFTTSSTILCILSGTAGHLWGNVLPY